MLAKFNPTGTHVHKGFLKVRMDLYPEVGDKTYPIHHVQVPVIPPEGYQGTVDGRGRLVDQNDYDNWIDSLPKVWQLNPALCHFIRIKETSSKADLTNYLEQIFTPTLIKTLDDSLILSNSIHLISPLMRNKGALTTEKIVTKDIEDLIETVNSRFANLVVEKTSGDKGLSITPQTIDIGAAALFRDANYGNDYTLISVENPANASGTIDTVEIYAQTNLQGCEVAVFEKTNGLTFTTRPGNETIGAVAGGGKRTFTGLDMDVETGDYIGMYWSNPTGLVRHSTSGGAGIWSWFGDRIPCTDFTFEIWGSEGVFDLSLYGTGTEAGAPVVVTPTTLALSITEYAPSVIIGIVSTPSTLALTITTYIPTIAITDNQLVTPTTLSLEITAFIPSIDISDHQVVTPGVLALVLTTYIPSAIVGTIVIPTTLVLSLTTFVPTISTPRLVTPSTLVLSLTEYAPNVLTPRLVTPSTKVLALTLYAPTIEISDNIAVTPTTLALTLATFIPGVSISDHQSVTPTTLALSLVTFAPSIIVGIIATPGTKALTLNTFASTVSTPRVVTPSTLALSITTYAPSIVIGTVVTPSTLVLVLTKYVPTILTPRLVTPTTVGLIITSYIPTVSVPILATPTTLALSITTYAPLVSTPRLVTPTTIALSLTTYIPSAVIGTVVTPSTKALILAAYIPTVLTPRLVTPSTVALIITSYIPTISISALAPQLVTPGTLALVLTMYIPTVSAPRVITPPTLALLLTLYVPTILIPGLVTPSTLALILTSYAPIAERRHARPTGRQDGDHIGIIPSGGLRGISIKRIKSGKVQQ